MALNTTPATVADGNIGTAALWNAEVRDAFVGIQAAWTAYTPTLTNITLGNGVLACAWTRYGKTVLARGRLTAGTTTTYAAGNLAFSLPPVTPHAVYNSGVDALGTGIVSPTTATRCPCAAFINGSGTLSFMASTPANSVCTNLVPGTFTTTSIITFDLKYEAA